MAFTSPIDIGKRACQHCGQFPFDAFNDDSRQATEINTCYDNLRLAELSRHTWSFSIRRCRVRAITTTTQLWTPPAYDNAANYTVGQVVASPAATYANSADYLWVLLAPTDVGDNPELSSKWEHYFGPQTADVFDGGATYAAGEIALVPPVYAGGTTYVKSAIVVDGSGDIWVSLVGSNTGNTPSSSPTYWTAWILPSSGQASTTPAIVYQSAPTIFLSLANNNQSTTLPGASSNWVNVGGTVAQLTILWPQGSGPITDPKTINLYRLPNGWLRPSIVPVGNKQQSHPWLGALYGAFPQDFTYLGDYFTAWGLGPYDIDFVADIADVLEMAPQFCESLAVRIGLEIDGPLTESKNTQKLENAYKRITGEAMRVDAIVQGTPTADLEEFVRVRL